MHQTVSCVLPLTRAESLTRLEAFLPKAGAAYARERNCDLGSLSENTVSGLSAAIRRRMLTEEEVVDAVLRRHGLKKSEKFIQEVCWRSYWKGWLEQRPEIWTQYRERIPELEEGSSGLLHEARAGETGIECFDAWAAELRDTGYLHNHVRMWVAAIWVHTLGLPWELGADWFLRQLLDGDPASNTLSWRWVAGLHTRGKHYVARASNIHTNTGGRFSPGPEVEPKFLPPEFVEHPPFRPFRAAADNLGSASVLVLCSDDWALDLPADLQQGVEQIYLLKPDTDWQSPLVRDAEDRCLHDTELLWSQVAPVNVLSADEFESLWKQELCGVPLKMPWIPTGVWNDRLAKVWGDEKPRWYLRDWDRRSWPYAKSGFFGFWKKIQKSLNP